MNWRITATYLAIQTAVTSVAPISFAQEPAADWADQLDSIIDQQVEITDADSGKPFHLSVALGSEPTFPKRAKIRPLHDRYLPSAFQYILESLGNHQYILTVHRNPGDGKPEESFFSATLLNLTPPLRDDSILSPGQWFNERFKDKFVFFRQLRKFGALKEQGTKVRNLPRQAMDVSVYGGVFLLSLIGIGAAMLLETSGSSRLSRASVLPLLVLGACLMTFSASIFGLNYKDMAIEKNLEKIDQVFQTQLPDVSNEALQAALEERVDGLLLETQMLLANEKPLSPTQNTEASVFIMSVLAPLLLVSVSRIGIHNPLLRCAAVLGIGFTSYAVGAAISRGTLPRESEDASRAIELETEHFFELLKH